ncbi:MAG: hypothetical protein AAFQ79_11265 [Pseudomonadota bacterium]
MSAHIAIEPFERGVLRLFAIDLPTAEARAFLRRFDETGPGALAEALGIVALNPDYVEVFAAEDIEELGLSGYLLEGYGVTDPDLTEQAAGLDRLEGCFAIIVSAAFDGHPYDLSVGAPLRLVATFREPPPVPAMETISAESAEGALGDGQEEARAPLKLPSWMIVAVGAGVLIVGLFVLFTGGRG